MKKIIYALIIPLIVVSGLVFSFTQFTSGSGFTREIKNQTSKKSNSKPLSVYQMKAAKEKWEGTPDGLLFKKWEASPAGKNMYAAEGKIRNSIKNYANMEGVVTDLSLPPGSRLGFGLMIRINGDDYILSFGAEKLNDNEFKQLHSLKVNDKIIIRSHGVSHAPKYFYPIISGDYVERDSKIIYKRAPRKGGC